MASNDALARLNGIPLGREDFGRIPLDSRAEGGFGPLRKKAQPEGMRDLGGECTAAPRRAAPRRAAPRRAAPQMFT